MNKTFDEILSSMLEEYQKGEKTLDQIIAEATAEAEFTEEDNKLLDEANAVLDKFDEKAKSLDEAKKKGISREEWLLNEIEVAAEGKSDEEKAKLLNSIESALEERGDQLLEEE